jgi:predicted esterase
MWRKRFALPLIGLSVVLIAVLAADGPRPEPGRLTGWTIIRTPDGLRCEVPVDWPVDVEPAGTTFASDAAALDSRDSVPAPQSFRALVVSGGLEDLPLPAGTERSMVAIAMAGDEEQRGMSLRGATGDGQTMLVVRQVGPDMYGGVFASAAPGSVFPYRRELESIVSKLRYQAGQTGGSASAFDYWREHVRDVRRSGQEPPLWYDLMVPEGKPPKSGWPLLVLAHANTYSYAAIAQEGLAIVVTPHFTWNTFEEDRRILDAILDEVEAGYPVNRGHLVIHGCSVGGRFTFQYTAAEPYRVYAAVPMAAFDLEVPPADVWHIPFVFFYGDHDTMYAGARAAIEGMQRTMDSVELYLDAGQGHTCDPALGLEAVRAFLAG